MADHSPDKNASRGARHSGKRVRLPPEVRQQQILDAALVEFSAVGFEGATMDKIAQRTGLTKAGLYAHFESKERILEVLLVNNIFNQSAPAHWQWREGATLEETVDQYLDNVYRLIRDPRIQATFRLLITESGRAPERIHRWSREIFRPYSEQRQRDLDECVANGLVPDNTLTRKFSLASAPALQAMVSYWLLGADEAEWEVSEIRAAHREMLLKMLSRDDAP